MPPPPVQIRLRAVTHLVCTDQVVLRTWVGAILIASAIIDVFLLT